MSAATVHIDGAARGNPGPAAFALTLDRPGHPPAEEAATIGTATNNVAEYTALIRALERAAEVGVKVLDVFSDSELLVKQMNGEYRVKNADLQELYREAQELRKRFERVALAHVRRGENKRADFLCNEALDGRPVFWQVGEKGSRAGGEKTARQADSVRLPHSPIPQRPHSPTAPRELEEEAVALLNAFGRAWAAGKESPAAVEVWDRLWAMLGEHGVVKGR